MISQPLHSLTMRFNRPTRSISVVIALAVLGSSLILFGCSKQQEHQQLPSPALLILPANYQGTAKGEVLDRIYRTGQSKPEILLGQNIGCAVNDRLELKQAIESVAQLNRERKYPAIIGVDYGWGEMDLKGIRNCNRLLIEHWSRGGLVTINFDPGNPLTGKPDPNDITPVDLSRVCESGTAENIYFSRQLKLVAAGFKELQDAGVVVLWRPIHEPNGGWFWWCSHDPNTNRWTTPEEYRRLWHYIHREMTQTYGLNNLLWVYSPAAMAYSAIRPTEMYYPGDEYVDIIGIDLYTDSFSQDTMDAEQGFSRLRKFKKPLAICEIGSHLHDGQFDTVRCLDAVLKYCPDAKYMLFWHSWGSDLNRSRVAIVDCQNPVQLMNDPRVILVSSDTSAPTTLYPLESTPVTTEVE